MKQFDFIAIGDITTDAFIRLQDAHRHCNLDKVACELCVEFGSKVPYESVTVVPAVGNAANAAIAAARLGLNSAILSDQGDDLIGKNNTKVFRQEKISTEFLKNHWKIESNYHYVLWFGDERTILVMHHRYPYKMVDIGNPTWMYLTSLGPDTVEYQEKIVAYLKVHPHIKLAFQPGTFQINLGKDKLAYFYKRAEIFFCNVEEAEKILNHTAKAGKKSREKHIVTLMNGMRELGTKIVVVTDGPNGAYVGSEKNILFMPPYPDPKPPFERTGAGDAFASTFTAALALDLPIEEAIKWAPINSMSVVQKIGARAGLLDRDGIEKYLDAAPASYRPKRISF